jgi:hypothetical protein
MNNMVKESDAKCGHIYCDLHNDEARSTYLYYVKSDANGHLFEYVTGSMIYGNSDVLFDEWPFLYNTQGSIALTNGQTA